jgi:hypothetical protein
VELLIAWRMRLTSALSRTTSDSRSLAMVCQSWPDFCLRGMEGRDETGGLVLGFESHGEECCA